MTARWAIRCRGQPWSLRLDSFARHMSTLLLAMFLVALIGNLLPRHPEATPYESVPPAASRQ